MGKKKARPKLKDPEKDPESEPPITEDKPKPNVALSQREVGEHFKVKLSTVKKWSGDGMPGQKGHYDLEAIAKWVMANHKAKKPHRDKGDTELSEEAARAVAIQEIEKAAKLELERKKLERVDRIEEGGLCRLDDVNRFITEFLTEFRQNLTRMVVDFSAGYGPKLQPSLREDLGARVELNLNQMADWAERLEEVEILG